MKVRVGQIWGDREFPGLEFTVTYIDGNFAILNGAWNRTMLLLAGRSSSSWWVCVWCPHESAA